MGIFIGGIRAMMDAPNLGANIGGLRVWGCGAFGVRTCAGSYCSYGNWLNLNQFTRNLIQRTIITSDIEAHLQ